MTFVIFVFGRMMFQYHDPDYEGGANIESLRQYQKAYLQGRVNRKPTINDERNENWKPLLKK